MIFAANMRSAIYVLSLALALVAQAGEFMVHRIGKREKRLRDVADCPAPVSQANAAGPALFTHDPYSIHRRSSPPSMKKRSLSKREDDSTLAELEAEDDLTEELEMASCSSECGVIKIEGVKSEKEALCSDQGLRATSESRRTCSTRHSRSAYTT